jgi:hypothetical protein
MQVILETFVEKILYILINVDGNSEDGKIMIEFALSTFDSFVT